jgi:hypothetical protein
MSARAKIQRVVCRGVNVVSGADECENDAGRVDVEELSRPVDQLSS